MFPPPSGDSPASETTTQLTILTIGAQTGQVIKRWQIARTFLTVKNPMAK
jgi:hypothetical protein